MAGTIEADICVLGAGSAGLTVAAGASQMGARTVLVEKGRMGGDCLNYGCVPSKSLIAAANAANGHEAAARLGVRFGAGQIDYKAVHDHVHGVIAAIAPHDSVERFEGMGVKVLRAAARFLGPREVEADGQRIRARRFVIATGSTPRVPPIPGLDSIRFLTNETVFDLTERPEHLVIVGGGAIGCELGQAFRRLGAQVSIVDMGPVLANEDPELVEILRTRLRAEGIALYEGVAVIGVERQGAGIVVRAERDGRAQAVTGSALLLAVGRKPGVAGLDLEAAGVAYDEHGIKVDERLRTSNKRIYAAGDVTGGLQFTHVAGYHAGVVLQNALFRWPAKVDSRAVPRVTYTDPELAHVGLDEAAARAAKRDIRILRWPFAEMDRAQAERRTEGLVKVIATPRGKVLGASILGPHAGELIHSWVLACAQGLKLSAVARMIAPYPTLGEINKRVAGSFYTEKLFSERTKRLVRLLARFG